MGISYKEIALLELEFDKQCEERGVEWVSEDVRQESLNDFISQYEEGNDQPEVLLLGYGLATKLLNSINF